MRGIIEYDGRDKHERRPMEHPEAHEQRVLRLRHVACEPCHEGGRAEAVDVGEGKSLDLVEKGLPQISRETLTRLRREFRIEYSDRNAEEIQGHHSYPHPADVGNILRRDSDIHDLGHEQGHEHNAGDVAHHEADTDQDALLVLPEMRVKPSYHGFSFSFRSLGHSAPMAI